MNVLHLFSHYVCIGNSFFLSSFGLCLISVGDQKSSVVRYGGSAWGMQK